MYFLSIEWSVNFSWRVHPFLCSTFLVIVHQISEKLMPFLPDENFCIHLLCCFARVSASSFIVWNFPCSLKLIGDKRFKKRLQKFVCVTGVWILSWALSKYLEWLQGLLLYAYTLMWHCFKLHKTMFSTSIALLFNSLLACQPTSIYFTFPWFSPCIWSLPIEPLWLIAISLGLNVLHYLAIRFCILLFVLCMWFSLLCSYW